MRKWSFKGVLKYALCALILVLINSIGGLILKDTALMIFNIATGVAALSLIVTGIEQACVQLFY